MVAFDTLNLRIWSSLSWLGPSLHLHGSFSFLSSVYSENCLFSQAVTPSLPLPFLFFFLYFFYDAGMKSGALCILGKHSKLTNVDSVSHWIAQTGLEFTMLLSVTLNSRSSCLAPNSGMIRRMPYILPMWILDAYVNCESVTSFLGSLYCFFICFLSLSWHQALWCVGS